MRTASVTANTFVSSATCQVRCAMLVSILLLTASVSSLAKNINVSPAILTFAKTIVGVTSASKSVTITNNGASAQAVSVVMSGDFSETDNCSSSVAAGGYCTVKISFAPTLIGSVSGSASIYDNSKNLLAFAGLTGTGGAPVTTAPASLSFTGGTIGTLSAAKTFKLTNNSSGSIQVTAITASTDYVINTGTCLTTPLAKAASCTVSVQVHPTSATDDGAVIVIDNAPNALPLVVKLTSTGATGGTTTPISLSKTSLTFKTVTGGTSATQTITVKNTSTVAVTIGTISASGYYAIVNNTCPASLAAGKTCTFGIAFNPVFVGNVEGSVAVTYTGNNSPQLVDLSGTSEAPLTVAPAKLTFAAAAVGTISTAQKVTITNNSANPATLRSVVPSGDFQTQVTGTTCSTSSPLAAGKVCTIEIQFAPTIAGPIVGSLTVANTASPNPLLVPFSGTGTAPAIVITSANSATFTKGTVGSFTVTATGTPTPGITESGALPTGVTFSAGVLSGTPTQIGTWAIVFTASNGVSPNATQNFTLTVTAAPQAPVITSANSATFTKGTVGSFTVTATGTPTPSTTESGALPGGVTFNAGILSGTPTASGTFPITFTASNGVLPNAVQNFTLTVSPTQAPVITSASSTAFTEGVAGSFTVTATGSPTPSITESGALPGGVKFNAGILSGTATASGTFPITFTASNGILPNASQSFTLTVNASGGALQISSLSEMSGNPFDLLTINGSSFSNGTAAISVMFIPESGDPIVMLPVSVSDPSNIQVMVPPFFNSAGNLAAETVDIQVVAYSSTTTYASNTITGLQVNALPTVSTPTGAMTAALLSASVNMASSLQSVASGNSTYANISMPLAQFTTDVGPLADAVETLVADPSQSPITIPTANGQTVTLSLQQLAQSDQLAQALVAAIVNQGEIPTATSTAGCPAATGDSTFDSNLCSMQQYFQNLAGQVATPAASRRALKRMTKPRPELTKAEAAIGSIFINLSLGVIAEGVEPVGGYLAYEFVVAPVVTSAISLLVTDQLPSTATAAAVQYEKAVALKGIDTVLFDGAPVMATTFDTVEAVVAAYEEIGAEPPTPDGMLTYHGPINPSTLDYNGSTGSLVSENIQPPTSKMPPDSLTLVLSPTSTPYTLSVTTSGSGTVNTFPTSTSLPAGTAVQLTAVASSTSTFANWGGACSGTGACNLTMNANQSVSATFTNGVTDAVSPSSMSLGSIGGCPGGSLSGAISVSAPVGVTWTTSNDGVDLGNGGSITVSPGSGSGSGVVTVTLTAPPQAPLYPPTDTCNSITAYPLNTAVNFAFSSGQTTQIYTTIAYTFIGVY